MSETFWYLDHLPTQRFLAEWADEMPDGETIICPVDPGHQRGGMRMGDLSIILPGTEVEDIVWTWYHDCIVQDHVLDLFRKLGVNGFDVKPVKARFARSKKTPPTLWEIVVTGWAGVAPPESGVRPWPEKGCPACDDNVYTGYTDPSKLISPAQWDGSDFFIVWPLPRFRFVTDRVKNIVEKHQLTGCRFVPPGQLKRDNTFPLRGGRLCEHMPERRARELGVPLGIY